MKLGHKLILAPVITAAVVLATGQLDSVLLGRSGEEAMARFDADLNHIQALSNVQDQVGQMHTGVYRAMTIIGSYSDAQTAALRKDLSTRGGQMKAALGALTNEPGIDATVRTDIEAAGRQIDDYVKRSDAAVDLASVDPNTGVAAMQGADEAYGKLTKVLAAVAARMKDTSAATAKAAAAQTARTHWLLALLSLAVAGAVVGLFWLVLRKVAKALEQASGFAREIAEGNLCVTVETDRKDELGELLSALGAMRTSLVQTVSQVRSTTDSISTASAEIAMGNQDLSARTEQTASNLEQTAASMEQLTATVRQSADAARQANQLAASAAEIAARGGRVVNQVVTTMDEINHSSKKISDIIGVIDGIAFQTNILALNAAVEAARAGEQGRGFAVVAGEVRNLAQRSAQAAKEIKGLIGTSVDKVESGSRLVADAGQTMSEIVGSVQRVSDIIGEITAAAGEQSDGIGQVNTAVNQLDQMTQQNAALVEESAAAAESLKDQASRLAQVVQVFRIDGSSSVGALAPAPARAAV
ncbi:MAG: HAMP domain-containing protein, partial [Rubrivivax sp.]|nr:HAMP domain-containing protein [Rubrivivax sp.]